MSTKNRAAPQDPTQDDGVVIPAARRLGEALGTSLRSAAVIRDPLSKGQRHEDDLIHALAPLLLYIYRVAKGPVVNARGEQSRPQDVVIINRLMVGEVLSGPSVGLHPIEALPASLQIKKNATVANVRAGIANIASMKALIAASELHREGRLTYVDGGADLWPCNRTPFGALIFLTSKSRRVSLVNTYRAESAKLPIERRPNAMLVLDDFACFWGEVPSGGEGFKLDSDRGSELLVLSSKVDPVFSMVAFTHFLWNHYGNTSIRFSGCNNTSTYLLISREAWERGRRTRSICYVGTRITGLDVNAHTA